MHVDVIYQHLADANTFGMGHGPTTLSRPTSQNIPPHPATLPFWRDPVLSGHWQDPPQAPH